MSDKAVVSGQLNLVDESSGLNVLSYDLSTLFGSLTNVLEHNKIVRKIIDTDSTVALDKGGVTTIRGFMLNVKEGTGTITLKHDSNTVGIVIDQGILLFGSIDTVTIETASTQALTVEYLFFE